MKTVEQKQLEVKNYLTKTEQHLFKTKKGDMFKIITFEVDGELNVCKITISKDGVVSSKVRKVFIYEYDIIKQTWKHRYFPVSSYEKEDVIAIKHFKDVNSFFAYLRDKLTVVDSKNIEIMDEIIKIRKLFSNLVDKK